MNWKGPQAVSQKSLEGTHTRETPVRVQKVLVSSQLSAWMAARGILFPEPHWPA